MSINNATKGELEAEFTKHIIQFEKEYLGRGPVNARTYLINDMVLVRLQGVLTAAEEKLSENKEGQDLVREARRKLFETSRPNMEEFVRDVLGTTMLDLYSDISIESGERVIVLTVEKDFGR